MLDVSLHYVNFFNDNHTIININNKKLKLCKVSHKIVLMYSWTVSDKYLFLRSNYMIKKWSKQDTHVLHHTYSYLRSVHTVVHEAILPRTFLRVRPSQPRTRTKVRVRCKSKSYTYFCTRTTSYKSTTVWTHL